MRSAIKNPFSSAEHSRNAADRVKCHQSPNATSPSTATICEDDNQLAASSMPSRSRSDPIRLAGLGGPPGAIRSRFAVMRAERVSSDTKLYEVE